MRKSGLLACCMLLLGWCAEGDVLKIRLGEELRGTVQLVTFVVKDIQTIYPREELVSVAVSKEGNDALEVRNEAKLDGKIVSVMFEAPNGLRSVTREKIESITLDPATTMDKLKAEQKEDTEKKEETKSELSAEQKQALTKNRELYKSYSDAAQTMKDDAYDAVKTKYMQQVREALNNVQRLERTITEKLRRREEASGRTYVTTTSGGRQVSISDRDRLERNDGLANDQREYERAKAATLKLKSTIHSEETKVKDKSGDRVSRLETAYGGIRAKIYDGQVLTEDEMTARYEAALRLPGEKAPKVTTPKPTKTDTDPNAGKTDPKSKRGKQGNG